MPSFVLERDIAAPVALVFGLSLDADVHVESMSRHRERIVGTAPAEQLGEGDEVTWSARHFGIRFRMTSLVHDVDEPHGFIDHQVRGPFAEFRHRHAFTAIPGGTRMRDEIRFRSPFGVLGRLVDATLMGRHLERLIRERNDVLERRALALSPGLDAP